VIVLGEAFKLVHFVSFMLVVAGICLVQSFRFKKGGVLWNRGATYAMAAAFFWGITYSLFRFPATWIGAIPLSFVLELCVTCSAFVWMQFSKRSAESSSANVERKAIRHFFILAILLLSGTLFYNLAVQRVPILMLNITGSFTVTVSVLCGAFIYKEKLKPDQVLGIILLISSLLVVQLWG
jgi:drug/metabolite transporter (DMT)-like permease